ncbi:hypothetical protein J6590_101496 [Homalodisca vitripennis]|nr:hypothetical protein J6590_101496 [Homalodisca vitripennis]
MLRDNGYRKKTRSRNIKRCWCLHGGSLSDHVLASSPAARPLVVLTWRIAERSCPREHPGRPAVGGACMEDR